MNQEDYLSRDAVGLAELVATRQVSPGELLDAAMVRAAEVNPRLNAIILDLEAEGRAAIAAGLPAGPPDSALLAAYRDAGLVLFGKTSTPEFGLAPVTEPALNGPSRNPWDLTRSPGGSSGGSAAAVAAGIVPAAQASDGGGSIRIP